jgi:hypothetical protein
METSPLYTLAKYQFIKLIVILKTVNFVENI